MLVVRAMDSRERCSPVKITDNEGNEIIIYLRKDRKKSNSVLMAIEADRDKFHVERLPIQYNSEEAKEKYERRKRLDKEAYKRKIERQKRALATLTRDELGLELEK